LSRIDYDFEIGANHDDNQTRSNDMTRARTTRTIILRIVLAGFTSAAASCPLICATETIAPIREPAGTLSTIAAIGRLRITGPVGSPFTRLEPLMASFAHFVGFSEDRRTILHLHPKAPPLLTSADRGGPEMEFRFFTSLAGFYRLFVQVQVEGSSKFIPFGLQIGR
jgi:hypothetical protein